MIIKELKPTFSLDRDLVEQLKQLIPETIADGKINWETLKEVLGEHLEEESAEYFGLNWPGKRQARRLASMSSKGTLVPVPGEGIDEETTGNIFIEGDNLEVLKILQKSYAGRVKLIYIDPPYNTGHDFLYKDNYSDPLEKFLRETGQADEEGNLLTSNPKTGGRFHSNWLNMMYPRLRIAKNFLQNDGVIFISIDENEAEHLKFICNEIFGQENFLGRLVWKNATDNNPTNIAVEHEYVLVYCKNRCDVASVWKSSVSNIKDIIVRKGQELIELYKDDSQLKSVYRTWFRENKSQLCPLDGYKFIDQGGVYAGIRGVHNPGKEGYRYDVIHPETGQPCKQPLMGYRFPKETMDKLLSEQKIIFGNDHDKIIELKSYAHEYQEKLSSIIDIDGRSGAYDIRELFPEYNKAFDNPKPIKFLQSFITFLLKSGEDIILDFFAGSCSTAQAVMELNFKDNQNHKFIMIQLPEHCSEKSEPFKAGIANISDLGKERIRRILKKFKENQQNQLDLFGENKQDLGFKVYKLAQSNLKLWQAHQNDDIQALQTSLFNFENPLIDGWKETDLVTELQLLEGFPLDSNIEQASEFSVNHVHKVNSEYIDYQLFICLENNLNLATIEQVKSLSSEDVFICLDNALTDEAKLQLADGCNVKTI